MILSGFLTALRSLLPQRLKKGVGPRGEALAAQFLASSGYRLVARNVRSTFGEIDLVARDGQTLCFVEIKARRSTRFGWPEESVTPEKQRRLGRLAEWYCKAYRTGNVPVRFDVVSILFSPDGSVGRTRLIKGAFEV